MHAEIDPRRIEVIDDATAEMYRAMTGPQRVRIGLEMWEFARLALTTHLISENPKWTQEQVRAEVRRRMLGAAA
jgi:hypothetical protein